MIEIEKPRIECIETPTDSSYGKYIVEPLERGYGTTLGNSLRRVLIAPHCPVRLRPRSRSQAFSMSFRPSPVLRKT